MRKKNIPELKKKNADAIAAKTECQRVITNWIEYKAKWRKSHATTELNWEQNGKIDTCKYLWGINVNIMLGRLIKKSGEEIQFGCLP